MNGKTQSILLQVAFKQGASFCAARPEFGLPEVEETTAQFYQTLLTLHNRFGIEPDDGAGTKRSYPPRSSSQSSGPKPLPSKATKFVLDGTEWTDYRAAKTAGEVVPRHPDFKAGQESVWQFLQDGSPNGVFTALAAAADVTAQLV